MKEEIKSIIVKTPDDWHLHLRESPILEKVFPYSYKSYGRAIIMPNLEIPIITFSQAKSYYEKIKYLIKTGNNFEPLMTLFLSEDTKVEDVYEGVKSGIIKAIKFYPQGVTTNSSGGIKNLSKIYNLLEKIADFTCRDESEIHFLPFKINKQDIIEVIKNFEQQKIKI